MNFFWVGAVQVSKKPVCLLLVLLKHLFLCRWIVP